MKRSNLAYYLSFICILIWAHHTFATNFHPENTHYAHGHQAAITGTYASYITGTASALGIIPALWCGVQYCYQWWKSGSAATPKDAPDESGIIYNKYVPFMGERPERCKAEMALHEGLRDVTTRSYSLDRTTRRFLRVHNLDDRHYAQCTGNVLQHALHVECISLAYDSAHLKYIDAINAYHPMLAQAIDAGRACVHENDIKRAIAAIDWAYALYRYLEAAISGIGEGIEETVRTFAHPYDTCKHLASSSYEIVRCTLRMFHELGLIETLIDTDNDPGIQAYLDNRIHMLEAMARSIKRAIASFTGPQATQRIAATATHSILTGKCLSILLSFFSHAAHQAPHMLDYASKALAGEQHALVAADVGAVHSAQEVAHLSFFAAEKQVTSGELLGLVGAYKPLADELEYLRTAFAEYLLDNDKTLIHVFEGELGRNGKLAGLHHDYLGHLEMQGKIRIIEELPNGMYRAEVWFNGKWEKKTFFPKNWTRQEILERVKALIAHPAETRFDGGRFVVRGLINQTKIRIVLTPDKKIITFFPEII